MTDQESLKKRLGRIPSPPDERDYKLADYLPEKSKLGSDNPLVDAFEALLKSRAAKATKAWAQEVMVFLGLEPAPTPAPPSPSPTPTPTPTPTSDVEFSDPDEVLDQGDYGTCVGNGCAQWGNTLPIDDKFTEKDARAIYYEATVIDGQPDDPDAPGGGQQGSTVRSGVKALQNRGRLKTYAFASTVDEIKKYLQTKQGPVIVGSDWTNDMFNPGADGYVKPTGGVAGGHCYLLMGDLESEGAFEFLNSWGSSWGNNGRFKMKYADFDKLLQSNGEACAAVELP